MIKTRSDLKEYIAADRAIQPKARWWSPFIDPVHRMKTLLRKSAYHRNNMSHSLYHKAMYAWTWYRCRRLQRRFCSEIHPNVFGKGLIIWHPERIITNPNARVGDYCSISSGVVIAHAHNQNPVVGDYVEFMIDSKALGGIHIANHVRLGANTMAIKDITEENTTWAGSPAHKISDRGTIEHRANWKYGSGK